MYTTICWWKNTSAGRKLTNTQDKQVCFDIGTTSTIFKYSICLVYAEFSYIF